MKNLIGPHLEKLEYFKVSAELGSLLGASKALNISQSSLSYSIKTLETAIGKPLFHRLPRGVKLTEAGDTLYAFCKRLELEIEATEESLEYPSSGLRGHIRIATHETLAIHIWPKFLSLLQSKYPGLRVSLVSERIEQINSSLLKRKYHIAVSVEPLSEDRVTNIPLYSDSFGLFVGAKNLITETSNKKRLSLKEIQELPILTDSQAHLREGLPLPIFLSEHGLNGKKYFEVNSFEAAIRFAAEGLGVAAVPKKNAIEATKQGLIRPISIKRINAKQFGNYKICASFLKDDSDNEKIVTIVDQLQKFIKAQT